MLSDILLVDFEHEVKNGNRDVGAQKRCSLANGCSASDLAMVLSGWAMDASL